MVKTTGDKILEGTDGKVKKFMGFKGFIELIGLC